MNIELDKSDKDQSVWITLKDTTCLLRIYEFGDLVFVDVKVDDDYVLAGHRVMCNSWILPAYVAVDRGNIRFEAYAPDANEYVSVSGFNDKFRLAYYLSDEIEE